MTTKLIDRRPGAFAFAFFTVAILMATLAPFDFHWLSSATAPVVRFTKSDVAQNILLFAPFGFVLASTGRFSLWRSVLLGVLLSASVEFAQLSIVGRASNLVDVITNGTGTGVGFLYASRFLQGKAGRRPGEVFAAMALPLCWIIAMREVKEPAVAFLVVPVALVALRNWPVQWLHQGVWLAGALLPVLYASREHELARVFGLPFTLGMIPIAFTGLIALAMPILRIGKALQLGVLLAVLAILIVNDAGWFALQGAGLRWTAQVHLHWAGEATCLALLVFCWLWVPVIPRD